MPTYRNLPTEEIKVSAFNPNKRTNPNLLTGLLLNIQQNGIMQPLVLNFELYLADGHRRLACAKRLKKETVPVAIFMEPEMSAAELWITLNGDTMSLSSAQWLAAVAAGLPLDTVGFPAAMKLRIQKLIDLVGLAQIGVLAEQGRSPMIVDAAERMVRYLDRKDDVAFLIKALNWLIDTGNAWAIRGALDDQVPVDILLEAVEQNQEIRRVWGIKR